MEENMQVRKVERASRGGFTLIEIIIAIAIVGIMAAVAVPSVGAYLRDANEAAARTIISTAETAMESYRAKHSMKVPPEDEWVDALTGGDSPYIKGGPDKLNDPWGTPLRFKKLNKKGDFEIRSAGPDCEFDNEDDLTNDGAANGKGHK